MKKWFMVMKEVVNRQHWYPRRLNHTHNPPSNFPQHQTHQKGGCMLLYKEQQCMYVTFGQKPECIHEFWPKIHIGTRLLAKNLRIQGRQW